MECDDKMVGRNATLTVKTWSDPPTSPKCKASVNSCENRLTDVRMECVDKMKIYDVNGQTRTFHNVYSLQAFDSLNIRQMFFPLSGDSKIATAGLCLNPPLALCGTSRIITKLFPGGCYSDELFNSVIKIWTSPQPHIDGLCVRPLWLPTDESFEIVRNWTPNTCTTPPTNHHDARHCGVIASVSPDVSKQTEYDDMIHQRLILDHTHLAHNLPSALGLGIEVCVPGAGEPLTEDSVTPITSSNANLEENYTTLTSPTSGADTSTTPTSPTSGADTSTTPTSPTSGADTSTTSTSPTSGVDTSDKVIGVQKIDPTTRAEKMVKNFERNIWYFKILQRLSVELDEKSKIKRLISTLHELVTLFTVPFIKLISTADYDEMVKLLVIEVLKIASAASLNTSDFVKAVIKSFFEIIYSKLCSILSTTWKGENSASTTLCSIKRIASGANSAGAKLVADVYIDMKTLVSSFVSRMVKSILAAVKSHTDSLTSASNSLISLVLGAVDKVVTIVCVPYLESNEENLDELRQHFQRAPLNVEDPTNILNTWNRNTCDRRRNSNGRPPNGVVLYIEKMDMGKEPPKDFFEYQKRSSRFKTKLLRFKTKLFPIILSTILEEEE
jgi:hypothetical protein